MGGVWEGVGGAPAGWSHQAGAPQEGVQEEEGGLQHQRQGQHPQQVRGAGAPGGAAQTAADGAVRMYYTSYTEEFLMRLFAETAFFDDFLKTSLDIPVNIAKFEMID